MDFPIADLLDEEACYARIFRWLHPGGWPARVVTSGTA